MTNDRIKDEAKQDFKNTDYALKLYNQVHQEQKIILKEPQSSEFYQQSAQQKQGKLIHVGAAAFAGR